MVTPSLAAHSDEEGLVAKRLDVLLAVLGDEPRNVFNTLLTLEEGQDVRDGTESFDSSFETTGDVGAGCGRTAGRPAAPAQIPAGAIDALGSCLR
jgi:hypothetical protein